MKKIFRKFTLLLLLVPFLNSCDLDPINYSDINPSIFPQSEEDLQSMVLSCYYPLRGSWWDGINTTSERGQMFVNDACTEILAGKFGAQKYCHELSFNTETTDVTYFYYTRDEPYGFIGKISRCTTVMDMIEKSELSREEKDRYIAEVRCARGYLSYILYDMFGPLVSAPIEVLDNPLNESPLPRLSREGMVKFIEDDLKFAADNLPYPRDTEYGIFSRGLANMLLIRLYLHETPEDQSYYNKVETIAREMMTADYGYAWSPKRITVSTVGLRKGPKRLLDESECHLAVSLHNPFADQRARLMPAENSYALREIVTLLREYDFTHQRRLSFEYTMFEGVNDTPAHAKELLRLLDGLECRMNLIRFHPVPGVDLKGTSEEGMLRFRDYLTGHGLFSTIRASRGQDIFAACGLLSTAKQQGVEL